jgi:pimeloyl-ACP methyl ester carboxylesterase
MRRLVALVAAAALLATAAEMITPAVAAPKEPQRAAIGWGRCDDPSLRKSGAQCAMLDVPLDYGDPGGTQIQIAVSRIKHTTPDVDYQGVMLVNPGGPGGSGLSASTYGQYVPHHAGDVYDWIGFDPRGVGSSEPSISCLPNYFHGDRPPYIPTSKSLVTRWRSRSEKYADACEADASALLPHMTTIDAAKDMDSIRQALGVARINYYGFSYGTYLGQVYATLFPGKIRRAVFDATVDPRNVWYQANLNQDVAFQRTVEIFFRWVAKYDDVYGLGKTGAAVEKQYYKVSRQLDAKPAGGVVGPDEWNDAILYAGYYQVVWTYLASVFSGWVNDHDTQALIGAYEWADGPGDDNGFAVYNAVQCTDVQWPQAWSTWRQDNWDTYEIAPFETWGNAWFNAPCLYWAAPAGVPTTVDGGNTRVLMVDETLDAATPYPGSLYVRHLFPKASLIAEPGGTTHAGTLYGNGCVDNKIAAFLATGKLPTRQPGYGADVKCKPLPKPVPETARVQRLSPSIRARLIPIYGP